MRYARSMFGGFARYGQGDCVHRQRVVGRVSIAYDLDLDGVPDKTDFRSCAVFLSDDLDSDDGGGVYTDSGIAQKDAQTARTKSAGSAVYYINNKTEP